MSPRASVPLLVMALSLAPRAGSAQAPDPVVQVTDTPVAGSPVRRATAVVDYPFDFARVSAKLLDFAAYPTFLRRFRSARVIHRNRADTDVYFEVELPRSIGNFWFLHRMRVTRARDRLQIDGVSQEGNAGYVETRVDLARTGENSCRMTFTLYVLPTIPALPDSVTQIVRNAVEGGAQGIRRAVESR
jgi:ribosome-associated toxin RatA of RatAB toxin-antitoxin module